MEFYPFRMRREDHLRDYNELLLKNVRVLEEELVSRKAQWIRIKIHFLLPFFFVCLIRESKECYESKIIIEIVITIYLTSKETKKVLIFSL